MKTLLLLLMMLMGSTSAFSTVWNVEVGGGGTPLPTPFYAPQFLTIEVGDTVLWTWSSGQHNVTHVGAFPLFASGDITFPGSFQYVFNTPGIYDYNCTLFNHAATQFGTITVEEPVSITDPLFSDFTLYPNPVSELLRVETSDISDRFKAQVYEVGSGKLVKEINLDQSTFEISTADLANGRYLLLVSDERRRLAKMFEKR